MKYENVVMQNEDSMIESFKDFVCDFLKEILVIAAVAGLVVLVMYLKGKNY